MFGLKISDALEGMDPEQQSRFFRLIIRQVAKELAGNPAFLAELAKELTQHRTAASVIDGD